MSHFAVTIEEIGQVVPHPNADRLDLASLKGIDFKFVVGKGQWKEGDKCLYFPLDSIIPKSVLQSLGLEGKLSGKNKDRVKTIRLRGEISQGLVGPLSLIDGLMELDPESITKFLGVVKHEQAPLLDKSGNLLALPSGLSVYDIEGCERYFKVVDYLMDKPVLITEKIEGQNVSVSYNPIEDKVYVNQRRFTIEEIPGGEHSIWKLAREKKLIDTVQYLAKNLGEMVTIYGEFFGSGVQGNIYRLNKQEFVCFDIKIGQRWVDAEQLIGMCVVHNIPTVPILSSGKTLREWLNGKDIKAASDGESVLFKTDREGIVIKPMIEEHSDILSGRLILKQRGPIYCSKEE